MTDNKFKIVGVSTMGKITKFRVANGAISDRVKILERAGCTNVHFIELPDALGKIEAIEAYKALHPDAADIRMPNTKEGGNAPAKVKTVTVKKARGTKTVDAATALLKAVEEA